MNIARNILAAALLALGVSAYAQQQHTWTVNVPFDFTVRHTSLDAGKYTVRQSGSVVFMTSQDGKTANVLTNTDYSSQPATHSSLTFKLNDGEYALAQIKTAGSNTELDAVVSKHAPRQLEASNAPQTVEVAALGTR